jgi:protein-tyrosine-phosphatase
MKIKNIIRITALFVPLTLSACNVGSSTPDASSLSACNAGSSTPAASSPSTTQNYLYVCGGNTGRSVAAEAIAKGNGLNAFSRASGLDPTDPRDVEKGVINALSSLALAESKAADYYTKYILGHQAQQISYTDIKDSSQLYTMTKGHLCRVILTVKTQATTSQEADLEFTKVHSLSKCALGNYIEIPDGFGTPESQESVVYGGIVQQINGYIHTIQQNNGNCVTPTNESDISDPTTTTLSLDEATQDCCNLYRSDLNKRFNNYCGN